MQDDSDTLKRQVYGPWNPGIKSDIPRNVLPLATVYRPENVSTTLAEAGELKQFCGLEMHELVAFRPERLVVHEVLIRVTADLAIYDGRRYEDLGLNFRRITGLLLSDYIEPNLIELRQAFANDREDARKLVDDELRRTVFPDTKDHPNQAERSQAFPIWSKLFGASSSPTLSPKRTSLDHAALSAVLLDWEARQRQSSDNLEKACLSALHRVVSGIVRKHGRLIGDIDLVSRVAVGLIGNDYGSSRLGRRIEPYLDKAIAAEGFRRLPSQANPVVLNTKGASASGKSTMRPYQQQLVNERGLAWEDFALISPDIWRKQLLDYDSLGSDYKYAGMLCGHEIEIVDRKLDRYIADKSEMIGTPHLLIDRFRFDSFSPDADEPVRLLTRFGDLVYMFFMVTPPAATVERAWRRGQIVGRYKAVDDLLAHNVEAYSGMPELFFSWAQRSDKRVHYEFLDNTVPLGSRPRTIAYGWNGEINVLDIAGLLNIERFRKVNVRASRADDVFKGQSLAPEDNTAFLKRCTKLLPVINFADQFSGRIYGRIEKGRWTACDPQGLARALQDRDTTVGLTAVGLPRESEWSELNVAGERLEQSGAHTIGAWGASALSPVPGQFGG